MATRRDKLIWLGLAVALCLGVLVSRTIWEGTAALGRGVSAAKQGDTKSAIRHWRRATRWYLPGASHVSAAYEHLEELAVEAERAGDMDTSLAAWRAIRRSVLATRSFYVPHEQRLSRANQHIAGLMAAQEDAASGALGDVTERRDFHLRLLERPVGPSVAWSLLALFGLLVWVGGGFLFAWRGVSKDDRLQVGISKVAGALVVSGLLLWMLGLYKA